MKIPKGIRVSDTKLGKGILAEKGKWALISYSCFLPQGELVSNCQQTKVMAGSRDVIPAIGYGILGMSAGGIRELKVSPNLTHCEKSIYPSLPPNATLKYHIEMHNVAESWEELKYLKM